MVYDNYQLVKYGGKGGMSYDDTNKIFDKVGGKDKVKRIRPKRVKVGSGNAVSSIQFDYEVETVGGAKIDVIGDKHGGAGSGEKMTYSPFELASDELITKISGVVGKQNNYSVIMSLEFITSKGNKFSSGPANASGEPFSFPVKGYFSIYGQNGGYLDAFGVCVDLNEVKKAINVFYHMDSIKQKSLKPFISESQHIYNTSLNSEAKATLKFSYEKSEEVT